MIEHCVKAHTMDELALFGYCKDMLEICIGELLAKKNPKYVAIPAEGQVPFGA